MATPSITVFVKGVSFDVDDKQFEEAFAEVGPIRTVFLVRKSNVARHLGYGFVTYALLDDAKRAVETMDGKTVGGRAVSVSFAKQRGTLEERRKRAGDGASHPPSSTEPLASKHPKAVEKSSKDAHAKAASAPPPRAKLEKLSAEEKHRFVRTLAFAGFSDDSKAAALKLAMRKGKGKIEEVMDPAPEDVLDHFLVRRDGCHGLCVLLVCASVKDALRLVAALHGSKVMEKKATKGQGAKNEGEGGSSTLWARQLSGEGLHLKKWRVIVRNLPFSATQDTVRQAMSSIGFVWDVSLPITPEGKARGFAFITYTCKAHAEAAVKEMNGKTVGGRPVAVDWALAKGAFENQANGASSDEDEGDESEEKEEGGDEEQSDSEEEEGMESDSEEEREASEGEEDSEGGEDDEEEKEKELKQERMKSLSVLDEIIAAEDAEGKVEEVKKKHEAPKTKTKEHQKGVGVKAEGAMQTTVFVRGLHLDVTKQELQLKLSRFGGVKSCRLVTDKATGKLKGTAFVEFESAEAAERCASASKVKAGDRRSGISLNGAPLLIDVALTQDGARSLAAQRAEAAGGGGDKRNLHLSKEGVIKVGSEAWEKLSAGDKAKRERAVEERKAKLKNPNMYCSTTRLLIRNVPKDLDEGGLKSLCMKLVKERAQKAKPQIKHAKILMSAGDSSGAPKSRGRAFVEFEDAEHALVCLRQMNNNPAPFGPAARPIVEFAVEDARLKRKMALKATQRREKGEESRDEEGKSKMEKKRAWKAKLREKIAERKAAKGATSKAGKEGVEEQEKREGRKRRREEGGKGKGRRGSRASDERGGGEAVSARREAKAKRVREQAEKEEAVQVKKRRQEEVLDRLASDNVDGGRRQQQRRKNKPKKREATDKLDLLVGEYTKKLFGGGAAGGGSVAGSRKAKLARWFE